MLVRRLVVSVDAAVVPVSGDVDLVVSVVVTAAVSLVCVVCVSFSVVPVVGLPRKRK